MALGVIAGGALLASVVHVLSGPDHLAAVLPLAVANGKRALGVGALWGLGHGLGVVALGALSILTLARLELQSVANLCEVLVGVLLVVVGVRAVRHSRLVVVHTHGHGHQSEPAEHAHVHVHLGDASVGDAAHPRVGRHRHRHGALGFGLLHGFAGGGHLLGAVPALALSRADAAIYLAAYLGGAVLAMSAFASVCGRVVPASALPRVLRLAGFSAVGVGVFWVSSALLAA